MKAIGIRAFEELIEEKAIKSTQVIDVRARDAYQRGHIEGAINIPLSELEGEIMKLDKEEDYYLICYSGSFSTMASQMMAANGFKAINVQSGMNGYSGPTI